MDAVELNEQPTITRRRLSQKYLTGPTDNNRRRSSLIAPEHPSIHAAVAADHDEHQTLDNDKHGTVTPACVAENEDGSNENKIPGKSKRVSILTRQASTLSRVLALSSTSQSFQEEQIPPAIITAMIF